MSVGGNGWRVCGFADGRTSGPVLGLMSGIRQELTLQTFLVFWLGDDDVRQVLLVLSVICALVYACTTGSLARRDKKDALLRSVNIAALMITVANILIPILCALLFPPDVASDGGALLLGFGWLYFLLVSCLLVLAQISVHVLRLNRGPPLGKRNPNTPPRLNTFLNLLLIGTIVFPISIMVDVVVHFVAQGLWPGVQLAGLSFIIMIGAAAYSAYLLARRY